MSEGDVYVLLDPTRPAMLKIGRTGRTAYERARELKTAGFPLPLIVLYWRRVSDCRIVERNLHRIFADRRVAESEWFNVQPTDVIDALILEAQNYPVGPSATAHIVRREVLSELRRRHGQDIDPNLTVATLEDDGTVISLRTVTGDGTERVEPLDFIYEDTVADESILTPQQSLDYNVAAFLNLDVFGLLMCTNLINPDRADAIDRASNPLYMRQSDTDQSAQDDVPF